MMLYCIYNALIHVWQFSERLSNDKVSVAIVSSEMAQICIPLHYEMVKRSAHSSVHLCCAQAPRVLIYTHCVGKQHTYTRARVQSAWLLRQRL